MKQYYPSINFLMLMILSAVSLYAYAVDPDTEKRLDDVAERGMHIMPFDLEETVHVFSKTQHGGVQQVIANDESDTDQIRQIRKHLLEISEAFGQGDFSYPEYIHGADMPGLAVLKAAKPGQIRIEYAELPDGAQINYFSRSPRLIEAIHQWFDAQLSDHARHAKPGHNHEHRHDHDMHPN
ncbi:aspartate carbamoyltransferase [Nitrosomonas marina]|nr:aspartate carbamoyltransferase [Nitrosomonas marina]